MDRKELKKKAHQNMKKNYFKSVIVMFLITIIFTGGYSFTSTVLKPEDVTKETAKGALAPIVSEFTEKGTDMINVFNAVKAMVYDHNVKEGAIALGFALVALLFSIFVKSIIDIGKCRFFMESRKYNDTEVEKILFPYRTKRVIHLALIILIKNIFLALWGLTIIGAFIKSYEYMMITYILAENPNVSRKEAFKLSKEMMNGMKWNAFVLDLSMFGWLILSIGTFGLSDLLYFDGYREFVYAEFYFKLRNERKESLTYGELLNDTYLDIEEAKDDVYPEDKFTLPLWRKKLKRDFNQKYPIRNIVLFFFTFAIIGWLWEVGLGLVTKGQFANRGTMFGPWLPIYGTGGVLMLIVLKPFRKKPIVFFLMAMLVAGVLEYCTAWYLETFKHCKWWDYTGYFLNIHGRVCLEGLIVFGLAGATLTYFLCPLLNDIYLKIKPKVAIATTLILVTLFGVDFIYSIKHPNKGKGITDYDEPANSEQTEQTNEI